MADEIKTERVSITIRGKKGRRKAPVVQTKGPRYGPFTRPVDDDVPIVSPPVLLVSAFTDVVVGRSYDLTNPAAPKAPKDTALGLTLMTARTKTDSFPSAQGYAFTFDESFSVKLEAVNLSNPRKPVSTSSLIPSAIRRPVVEEGLLYWTNHSPPLITVVDVSDAGAISLIHEYNSVADFAAKQRFMGVPAVLNRRLYVASAPDFGGIASGDSEANSYLCTYNFDTPGSATQINAIILEASNTLNSVAAQRPPVVLGNGVVYVGFQYQNVPFTAIYTSKLLTFSLGNPDAPVLVNSVTVATDGPMVGAQIPGFGVDQLFINKSKTRLFAGVLPRPADTTTGSIKMYDITTPTAPVFLDSLTVDYAGVFDSDIPAYPADTGYVYVGLQDGSTAIYKYSNDVFEFATTVENAGPLVALDKKGFPL